MATVGTAETEAKWLGEYKYGQTREGSGWWYVGGGWKRARNSHQVNTSMLLHVEFYQSVCIIIMIANSEQKLGYFFEVLQ